MRANLVCPLRFALALLLSACGSDALPGPSPDAGLTNDAMAVRGDAFAGDAGSCPRLTFDFIDIPLGSEVWTVTLGDVNGDGALDIVTGETSYSASGGGHVILGDGHGHFTVHGTLALGAGLRPTPLIAIDDLNHDGAVDLLSLASPSLGGVEVQLGAGDGNFGPIVRSFAGTALLSSSDVSQLQTFAVADYDGDGMPDLVYIDAQMPSHLLLAHGAGDGTFVSPIDLGVESATALLSGDINGDGRADLLVAADGNAAEAGTAASLRGLLGTGTSTLRAGPVTSLASSAAPLWMTLADVDGDGRADLLAANPSIEAFRTAADGTLSSLVSYAVGNGTANENFVAADLDGDGRPELSFVQFSDSGFMNIFHGASGARLDATFLFAIGGQPAFAAEGDRDGDGVADLVAALRDSHDVVVMLSRPIPRGAPTERACSVCMGATSDAQPADRCSSYP
jgi:hypothetical protein